MIRATARTIRAALANHYLAKRAPGSVQQLSNERQLILRRPMKDQIKTEFQKVLNEVKADANREAKTREKQLTDRRQFEEEWRRLCKTVVVPAMKQVVDDILTPNGWGAATTDDSGEAVLEVWKGNMRSQVAGGKRPHIRFAASRDAPNIAVTYATQYRGALPKTMSPAQISEELVQQHVLEFFKVLAAERIG